MSEQTPQQKVVGIGCLVILLLIGGSLMRASCSDRAYNERLESEYARPAYRVTVDGILAEVYHDEVAAEEKYERHVIQLTGQVSSADTSSSGCRMYLGTRRGHKIRCELPASYHARVANLQRGDTVTVKGVPSIGLDMVTMHRCRF